MPFAIPNSIPYNGEILSTQHEQNYVAIESELNTNVVRRDGSVAMTGALTLPSNPTTDFQAATKRYVDDSLPVGAVVEYYGATAPSGWDWADGGTIARASAPLLAAAIAPNASSPFWVDSTNFRKPDRRDRVGVGKSSSSPFTVLGATGGSKHAVVVSHNHDQNAHNHGQNAHGHTARVAREVLTGDTANPAGTMAAPSYPGVQNEANVAVTVDAATASNIAATATNIPTGESGVDKNLQPYIVCNYIIRLR